MIFAIDPGPTHSGWVWLSNGKVKYSGIDLNDEILVSIKDWDDPLAIETITSYGMPVGKEVFESCVWIGRFQQAYKYPDKVKLIPRREVKTWLCGTPAAKDANVRAALLELFPGTGGGSTPQVGTKGKPGPLYGISGDKWSALALAVMVEKMK